MPNRDDVRANRSAAAGVRAHRTALVESDLIGSGTVLWAFVHVMPGAVIGANCALGDGVFVEGGAVLGDNVTVKNGVMIWDGVVVEKDAFLGPGVVFTNDRVPRSPRSKFAASRYVGDAWLERTHVGRGASVGAGAVLCPGVSIGSFALVAAGAVVTEDVAEHEVVAGNPARVLGHICRCGRTGLVGPSGGLCAACGWCSPP